LISAADRARLPASAQDAYPMSQLQRGMVFHSDYARDSSLYHDILTYRLRLPCDTAAIADVLAELVERHEILRTLLAPSGYSEPLQIVERSATLVPEVHDLRAHGAEQQQALLLEWLEREKRRGFAWHTAPLLRVYVHHLGARDFQLALSFHHAILDGWSEASLTNEFIGRYRARLARRPLPAPRLSVAYRDYIALERRALANAESQRYWTRKLEGQQLLVLGAAPATPSSSGHDDVERVTLHVPEGVAALAQRASVPLKAVLLAAHLKALSVFSGRADVTAGLVTNGRPESQDGDKLLGLFLNVLPLRLRLGDTSWMELIRQTFEAEQELLPHRHYPLAAVLQQTGRRRLFESLFNYTHFHVYRQSDHLSDVIDHGGYAENDLPISVNLSPALDSGALFGSVSFDHKRVGREAALELARCHEAVLAAMLRDPWANHAQSSHLSTSWLARIDDWNRTQRAPGEAPNLCAAFELQAQRTPDALAVSAGGLHLTYAELRTRANRLAHLLRRRGVGMEQRVAVYLERSVESVVAVLGVLAAGAAYVPLDPDYPAERLAFMLADARPLALVSLEARVGNELRGLLARTATVLVCLDSDAAALSAERDVAPSVPLQRANLAYVMYTSGSTGRPKGVMGLHGGVLNRLEWMWREQPFEAHERLCHKTALSFVDSVWELFGGLLRGLPTVCLADESVRAPALLAAQMARHEITRLVLVPALLRALLEPPGPFAALACVKHWVSSGEALGVTDASRLLEAYPGSALLNLYGSTEVSADALYAALARPVEQVPIGRPIDNLELRILDEFAQPVHVGVAGELCLGGAGLARGYFDAPALTAERFVPDPHGAPGARLYRSGDLGRYELDGSVSYLGRSDQQVKLRGVRVEPAEVEAALLRETAVLREAAVALRAGASGEPMLVAYVVAQAGVTPDPRSLRTSLRALLPEALLPGAFVVLERLPRTPSGKLDRQALPAPAATQLAREHVAPRTELERALAGIWAEVFGREQVSVHDDFFELGGHSLLATQVVSRMALHLKREVPVRALFERPSIAELASYLGILERAQQDAARGPARDGEAVEEIAL
jgi:amino acid adenylation domain-containing protein